MPSAKAIDIVIDIDCATKYCDLRLIVGFMFHARQKLQSKSEQVDVRDASQLPNQPTMCRFENRTATHF